MECRNRIGVMEIKAVGQTKKDVKLEEQSSTS